MMLKKSRTRNHKFIRESVLEQKQFLVANTLNNSFKLNESIERVTAGAGSRGSREHAYGSHYSKMRSRIVFGPNKHEFYKQAQTSLQDQGAHSLNNPVI